MSTLFWKVGLTFWMVGMTITLCALPFMAIFDTIIPPVCGILIAICGVPILGVGCVIDIWGIKR